MLTSCPECRTAFRVTQEQLGVRRGMVRCGRCSAVFNAYDNLQAELEAPSQADLDAAPRNQVAEPAVAPLIEPEAAPQRPAEARVETPAMPLYADHAASDSIDPPTAEPHAEPEWYERIAEDAVQLDSAAMADNPLGRARQTHDDILFTELHPVADAAPAGGSLWKNLLYGLLAGILLIVLLAQSAYFMRAPLVVWLPELRPGFAMACKSLGCDLPLSRDLEAMRIEASSLETDPEQAAHARLRVTFSNRARQAQDWPYFVLKLSDVHNTAMAQRVFRPGDYLDKQRTVSAGMAPRSEYEFQLDLDLGTLSAAGYEVKPYYP
jgi:predicted Zn finger-like uncharacterized protein